MSYQRGNIDRGGGGRRKAGGSDLSVFDRKPEKYRVTLIKSAKTYCDRSYKVLHVRQVKCPYALRLGMYV